jgi:hypothetical protein
VLIRGAGQGSGPGVSNASKKDAAPVKCRISILEPKPSYQLCFERERRLPSKLSKIFELTSSHSHSPTTYSPSKPPNDLSRRFLNPINSIATSMPNSFSLIKHQLIHLVINNL